MRVFAYYWPLHGWPTHVPRVLRVLRGLSIPYYFSHDCALCLASCKLSTNAGTADAGTADACAAADAGQAEDVRL